MFDFFKPVMDMVRGGGGQQTETTRKATPPEVKAKPEEKKGANGLLSTVSGLFKGLFDDLGSMGEDPTDDKDLGKSVEKNPPTKEEVEKGPESKVVDTKNLVTPEE